MSYETNTILTMAALVRERLAAAGKFPNVAAMREDPPTLSVFLRGFLPPPIHATVANCVAEVGWPEFIRLIFDGETELKAHEKAYRAHVEAIAKKERATNG